MKVIMPALLFSAVLGMQTSALADAQFSGGARTTATCRDEKKDDDWCKCQQNWQTYEALGLKTRFFLGGAKLKASGSVGNATGKTLDNGQIVDLDKDDAGASIGIGYYDKAIGRDLLFLSYDGFMSYCMKRKNAASKLLWWDAVKLNVQGGYGSSITEDDPTDRDLSYDEKWFYSVGLSYEIPFEGLVEGLMGIAPRE